MNTEHLPTLICFFWYMKSPNFSVQLDICGNHSNQLFHTAWDGSQKTHLIIALNPCQSLFMPFGASFYLENRLERLPIISKKKSGGVSNLGPNCKKNHVSHVLLNKNLGKIFLKSSCVWNRNE